MSKIKRPTIPLDFYAKNTKVREISSNRIKYCGKTYVRGFGTCDSCDLFSTVFCNNDCDCSIGSELWYELELWDV